jgi:protein-S-isoprenylcysteine O-methyltransferase Ste14
MASVALLESGSAENQAPKLWGGCIDCANLASWRSNTGNRQCYKACATIGLVANVGVYCYIQWDLPMLVLIAILWFLKNMVAIWGQDTPTCLVPGSPLFACIVYVFAVPSAMYMLSACRGNGAISFPYRDAISLALFVFGTVYAFAYEFGRFQWKKLPENKGRCHTVGLASLCIHPNYFGDLFTYNGWALASGSTCAFGLTLFQMGTFLWFVIPNADAYLAQRYHTEFPAYAAKTAPLFPFVRSPFLNQLIAWIGFVASIYASTYCTEHCQ